MTFANGYTVSVQFGAGNYCSHYNSTKYGEYLGPSEDAEVVAWGPDNEFIYLDAGIMRAVGFRSADQVLKIINKVAAM